MPRIKAEGESLSVVCSVDKSQSLVENDLSQKVRMPFRQRFVESKEERR